MLAISTVPMSLLAVLKIVRPCFTAPSYQTFTMLLVGIVAGPVDPGGGRTVTGMLKSASLSNVWSHDRVHTFFSRAAWDPARLGLLLATAVADRLLPAGAPVLVVVDDTLFRRRGKHVWGAGWAHDGSARGRNKTGYGNTWVVAAIIVQVPFATRPIALPVTARMWRAGAGPSRCELALSMIRALKRALPERNIDVVADAAYHHRDVAALPDGITWTTRLPVNAALTSPKPQREPGRRGRPRKKGDRLGTLTQIAAGATWKRATVTKYGKTVTVRLTVIDVQWYGPWKDLPARLILLKEGSHYYDLALITTDPTLSPEQAVQNYAARWGIEVVFQTTRSHLGAGQARNRTPRAVQKTIPFTLAVYTLTLLWYAEHGDPAADVAAHRDLAPWYTAKTDPSYADVLTALKHALTSHDDFPKTAPKPTLSNKSQTRHKPAAQAA